MVVALIPSLLACERPADAEFGRRSAHSQRYYTVDQQIRIEHAANRLWNGIDLNQSWKDAVTLMFDACGGSMRHDEIFLLGSYHPRAGLAVGWRSELEAAVLSRCRTTWNPSPDPICKVIVNAVAPEHHGLAEDGLANAGDR
jgi:hypothetical protein